MKQPSPAAPRSSVLVRGFGARTAIQLRCNNSTRLDLAMSETTSDIRNLRFCAGVVTPCRYNDLRANRPAQNQVCAPRFDLRSAEPQTTHFRRKLFIYKHLLVSDICAKPWYHLEPGTLFRHPIPVWPRFAMLFGLQRTS